MTMENIREQIRLLQETLEKAKRQINTVEHNLYREITTTFTKSSFTTLSSLSAERMESMWIRNTMVTGN